MQMCRLPLAMLLLATATLCAHAAMPPMAGEAPPPGAGMRVQLAQQKPAAPAPSRIDAVAREAAARIAGPFRLSSADGERACPVVLKGDAGSVGFAVSVDRPACAPVAFAAEVAGWLPDPSGSIRLLNGQGRTLAEFTEATGGSYEALREGDGVYFLAPPNAVAEGEEVKVEEVLGDWDLSRVVGTPVCRWALLEERAAKPGPQGLARALRVQAGCDASILRFNPVAWQMEGGNIVVRGEDSSAPIRFARQEDGSWARVPERGRPLLMSRP